MANRNTTEPRNTVRNAQLNPAVTRYNWSRAKIERILGLLRYYPMKSAYIEKLASSRFDLESVIQLHLALAIGIGESAPWCKQGHSLSSMMEMVVERMASQLNPKSSDSDERYETYKKLNEEIDATGASFFSPALHLNHYLNWMIEMGVDELEINTPPTPESSRSPSLHLQSTLGATYATSILISIKSALDKLVRVLHFYYPGIASHTIWGRWKKNCDASGFMSVVKNRKGPDVLLEHIEIAYEKWIHLAVAPRDALVHYKDSKGSWNFLKDKNLFIREHSVQHEDGSIESYGVEILCDFVNEWYDLATFVLENLASREPRIRNKTKVV